MVDEDDVALRVPVLRGLTYGEIHAFQHGLYAGAVEGSKQTAYRTGGEDHYWRMGFLVGMSARYVLAVLAGVGLGRFLDE